MTKSALIQNTEESYVALKIGRILKYIEEMDVPENTKRVHGKNVLLTMTGKLRSDMVDKHRLRVETCETLNAVWVKLMLMRSD